MLVKPLRFRRLEGGFTLVELLVTMLIVTVGLLGLAKLQATAVSNTSVARTRALMTFQAESLAGMIRANPSFWVTSGTTANYPWFKVDKAGAPTNFGMASVTTCTNIAGTCTPAQLAYNDMTTWAKAFNDGTATSAFPGATAAIVCVPAPPATACGASPTQPHGYDITLTWDQKLVAVNNRNNASTGATSTPVSMVMHVQP